MAKKKNPANVKYNQKSATVRKPLPTRKTGNLVRSDGKIFGNWQPTRRVTK